MKKGNEEKRKEARKEERKEGRKEGSEEFHILVVIPNQIVIT